MDIAQASISDMKSNVTNYSVDTAQTDAATGQKETTWQNAKASQYLGYYKKIPELKKAIDAFANYIVGKGYTADPRTMTILDHITGWGEDTFSSLIWNGIVCKKIYGDCFIEIIRDPETDILINLKILNPADIKIHVDSKGILTKYTQSTKIPNGQKSEITFQPEDILHLCNDRIADEIHGTSVIEACEWTILAKNEAMDNWKTVLHRNINPLKLVEVQEDNESKIAIFKAKWEKMTQDKETLFYPKGAVNVTIPPVPLQDPTGWIAYLDNQFYINVGVPKTILGGASGQGTEASNKVDFMSFDQTYIREQTELSADLWNQLYMRIQFPKPASLLDTLQVDQEKDAGAAVQRGEMQVKPNNQEGGA